MSKIDSLIKVNLGLLSLGLAHFTFASAAQEKQMSCLTRIFFTKSTNLIFVLFLLSWKSRLDFSIKIIFLPQQQFLIGIYRLSQLFGIFIFIAAFVTLLSDI